MNPLPIDRLREFAEQARRELFIASHIVLDEQVFDLLRAARERGVNVRLYTELADRDDAELRIKNLGLDGQFSQDDFSRHAQMIRRLAHEGVQIRSGPFFSHAKLWLADRRLAATGSVNLTSNSLGTSDRPAVEVLGVFTGEVAAAASAVALWLWKSAVLYCDYDPVAGLRIHERGVPAGSPPTHPQVLVGLPGRSNKILAAFCDAADAAMTEISLFAMSAYGWDSLPTWTRAITEALSRNVVVRLFRRPLTRRHEECDSVRRLRSIGLEVLEIPDLHAKGMLTDSGWTALWTGNLNPFSLAGTGRTGHLEVAVVAAAGSDSQAEIRQRFERLMACGRPA